MTSSRRINDRSMKFGINELWNSTLSNRRVSYFRCHSTQVFIHTKRDCQMHFYRFYIHFPRTDDPDMRSEDIIVTASHAIFHTEDKRAAPVAVVGFQFQQSALLTLFKNTTSNVCRSSQYHQLGGRANRFIHSPIFNCSAAKIVRKTVFPHPVTEI